VTRHLENRFTPAFGFGSAFNVGGGGNDYGIGITLDGSANLYVSGMYSGTVDFDPNHTNSGSNHMLTASGSYANFAAKYLANGTFAWATDLGPNGLGAPAETIAVQGTTLYAGFPLATPSGTDDAATVARIDAGTGAILRSTPLSTGGTTYMGVAVDPTGNAVVTGNNASSQAFVSQVDSSGNVVWTTTTSGTGTAYGSRPAVDAAGNVYATGSFTGTETFGSTPKTAWAGGQDGFIWKLTPTGGVVWAGSVGSDGTESGDRRTPDVA
jgi:hypothetical protein